MPKNRDGLAIAGYTKLVQYFLHAFKPALPFILKFLVLGNTIFIWEYQKIVVVVALIRFSDTFYAVVQKHFVFSADMPTAYKHPSQNPL